MLETLTQQPLIFTPDAPDVPQAGSPSLRRSDADTLIERSLQIVPVVVIDAGAVLDAASTVELCRLADAVVLAVPTKRQKTSQLEVVARQLSMRQGELLAVATDAAWRRACSSARAAHSMASSSQSGCSRFNRSRNP